MRAATLPFQGEDTSTIPGIFMLPGGRAFKATIDQQAVLAMRKGEPPPEAPKFGALKEIGLHTSEVLRPYQREGIAQLISMVRDGKGAILADDMGLGKTLQTLAVWDGLNRPWPLMIVAPASTRRGWVKECKRWLNVDAKLVETGAVAAEVSAKDGVIVTSYELLEKIPRNVDAHMLVMDEAHRLRGRRAKRNDEYLERCKAPSYKLALTGTPMWGRPRDLWLILRLLFGYRFGTADAYDYTYCAAFMNKWGGKDNKGVSRSEELKLRLSYVMVRRTKELLAAQLPPFTRQIRWLPPHKDATKALQRFAMRQTHLADALAATLVHKMDATVDLVEDLEGHAVVFTWQKEHCFELAQRITKAGFNAVAITGDMTHKAREAAIALMTQQKGCVVATIDSVGTGVNGLQFVASTAIFHALDYTPTKMAQAEARLHRLDSAGPVTAVFLALEGSADQLVVEKVVDKLDSWQKIMGTDATAQMVDTLGSPVGTDAEDAVLRELYAEFQTPLAVEVMEDDIEDAE